MRPAILPFFAALVLALAVPAPASAQRAAAEGASAAALDVRSPSARVRGDLGTMTVVARECRVGGGAGTRQRLMDLAVQEWGFFGFKRAAANDDDDGTGAWNQQAEEDDASRDRRRRRSRLPPAEAARVAPSIAGYWAVTPEGSWIVGRQNERWNSEDGVAARWNAPWSAAFISWLMCEAGLGATAQFQRAIAHHTYIDQAIRARDGRAPQAAFVAYDPGEAPIAPGDLLCASRRPVYRTLADRRRQMGVGARSHCDMVVRVDEDAGAISAIGGNVRGVVAMKTLPAMRLPGGRLRPHTGDSERPLFAHLKLRAAPDEADIALDPGLTPGTLATRR